MIALTFDTDYVDDRRMAEFLDLVTIPGEATFFCTRRYAVLDGMQHELCPHPTLQAGADWSDELERYRALFPAAIGWRSHSCVYSHLIAEHLAAEGYVYASTVDRLGEPRPRPYREAWGLWQLPIYYMDNLDFSARRHWPLAITEPFAPNLIERALTDDGVYIFDFHPIHVLLNSPSAEAYFERRDAFLTGSPLAELRHAGPGTHDFYGVLIAAMEAAGTASVTLADALRVSVEDGGVPNMPASP